MPDVDNPFEQKKVSGVYKNTEEVYNKSSSQVLKFIIENIKVNKNWSIVDLGTGTGIFAKQLAENGFKNLTLADPSNSMLEQAKEVLGKNHKYLSSSAEKLHEHLKGSADMIIAMNALHLFPDLNIALKSILNSLKPNGYFVFNTTAPSFAFESPLSNDEKKLLKANIEFYSGIAALSPNPIINKTKELLEMFYQGNYSMVYSRPKFKEIFGKYGFKEIQYKEILLSLDASNQKSIWQMIAKAFVEESPLIDKLIDSIEFDAEAKIRQACFIYQKTK